MAITQKWEDWSPARARVTIDTLNGINRPISERFVRKLCRDIHNGAFIKTAATISFFEDGKLADGQHRLEAIARSGKTITLLTVRGMPREQESGGCIFRTWDAIDGGRARNAGQILQMNGWPNATRVAGAVRAFANWSLCPNAYLTMSTMQIEKFLDRYARPFRWVAEPRCTATVNMAASIRAPLAAYYSFSPSDASEFMKNLVSGEMLTKGDPEYTLNRWLFSHDGSRMHFSSATPDAVATAIWYSHNGNKVQKLYGNSEARKWLLSQSSKMVEYAQQIMCYEKAQD